MANYEINGVITGVSPLLQSNPRHHHPSDPINKLCSPIRSKRMKTEEDHVALARFGFIMSAHWDKENIKDGVEVDANRNVNFQGFSNPLLPGDMLKAAVGESSKALNNRKGSAFARGVQIHDDFALSYDGPKEANEMWDAGMYRNDGGSRNGGSLVWITRVAIPKGWQVAFQMYCDSSQVELDTLEEMIKAAGKYIGLGSWRPANGGRFGRFTLDHFEKHEVSI